MKSTKFTVMILVKTLCNALAVPVRNVDAKKTKISDRQRVNGTILPIVTKLWPKLWL